MSRVARKFVVSGIVQGVGFRYFTQRAAARHQVVGYVRNRPDGSVEAYAEGSQRAVEAFRGDLMTGPTYAEVTHFEEEVLDPVSTFSSFRVER